MVVALWSCMQKKQSVSMRVSYPFYLPLQEDFCAKTKVKGLHLVMLLKLLSLL
jgi:hypothetical protein